MNKSNLELFAEAHQHIQLARNIVAELPLSDEKEFYESMDKVENRVEQEIKEIANDLTGTGD